MLAVKSKGNLIIDMGKYGQEGELGKFTLALIVVGKGDKEGVLTVVGIVDSQRPSLLKLFVFHHVLGGDIESVVVAGACVVAVAVDEDFREGVVGGW